MSASKSSGRAKRLRGVFAGVNPEMLAKQAQAEQSERKMTTAPTRALKGSFASIELENLRLKAELEKTSVSDLSTYDVLPSLVQDRLEWSDDDEEFLALRKSIEEDGQKLPILVRPHPNQDGKYQLAYGMRRTKACQAIGIPVRAYVQSLSDEELIIAQGLENNERKNLSFIEQSVYAAKLMKLGYDRSLVAKTVGTTAQTNVSKMVAIATAIPNEVVLLIGAAPRIGRPRWTSMSALFSENNRSEAIVEAIKGLVGSKVWDTADTNKKFDLALRVAEKQAVLRTQKPKRAAQQIVNGERIFGRVKTTPTMMTITIDAKKEPEFARYLAQKLSAIVSDFEREEEDLKK